jgi:hypothetical protein
MIEKQSVFARLGFVNAKDFEKMEKDCKEALAVILQCEEKDLTDNNIEYE